MTGDIAAINREDLIAITDDGIVGTITNLFDANGDDTDDISEAVSAVVRISDDEWFVVALADYETVQVH